MLSIKVNIANRVYPLTVEAEEEAQVRKAAQNVSEKVKDYEKSFAVKDRQDLLAMAALDYATSLLKSENQTTSVDDELKTRLSDLSDLITDQIAL